MEQTYRMMIVDDERIVREAIASYITWEKYGITVAKVAANALEALEYLKEHEVELVLVDIKMPVMDGLEMLKKVRDSKADIDFIILSGYADFKYAQEAIHYGARDYLLKPFDDATLLNAVLKCRDNRRNQEFISTLKKTAAGEDGTAKNHLYHYSQTVNKIMQIVDEEIANEELSLKWISSQKLFLNETYLSKVFQKEVNRKFSSYLLERRMLLAMQLLAKDTDVLIQDVARESGFGDNPQYFSIVFKKYTGYTPTEYKRKLREVQNSY